MEGCSINFRGTSGSGKTTIMRGIFKRGNFDRFVARQHFNPKPTKSGRERKPRDVYSYRGEVFGLPTIILGNYEPINGGCDTIPSVHLMAELLTNFVAEGNVVLYESLLISHGSKIIAEAIDHMGRQRNVMAFIDTPLILCLKRVQERRWAKGNHKEFNPANTTKDHQSVANCKLRVETQGYRTFSIDHRNAQEEANAIIQQVAHEQ